MPGEECGVESSRYDDVAASYQSVRPAYPDELFRAIGDYAALPAQPKVIEVGCGTGQATRQMVQRGWSVEAIEPGRQLIAVAEAAAGTTAVRFRHARFEDAAIESEAFDLVVAATSWHWVDSGVGYRKAHDALRPGGTIALFWNAHVPHTPHPDWVPIREVYLEVAPELADLAPLTPDRHDYDPMTELQRSRFFESIDERVFPFEVSYSTEAFLALIDTYASHRELGAARTADCTSGSVASSNVISVVTSPNRTRRC